MAIPSGSAGPLSDRARRGRRWWRRWPRRFSRRARWSSSTRDVPPTTFARLMPRGCEWVSGATDLALGMPAWWRGSETLLYRDTAIWLCVFAAAWGLLRAAQGTRLLRDRGALSAAAGAGVRRRRDGGALHRVDTCRREGDQHDPGTARSCCGVSARSGTCWRGPSQDFSVSRRPMCPMLRIEPRPSMAPGGAGPNDRPLFQVPSVPAGGYRVRPHGAGASGWLMVGIGRDQFSLRSGPLAAPPEPIDFRFPVDVRAIIVRGDEQARRSVQALTIEPISVLPRVRAVVGSICEAAPSGMAIRQCSFWTSEAFRSRNLSGLVELAGHRPWCSQMCRSRRSRFSRATRRSTTPS